MVYEEGNYLNIYVREIEKYALLTPIEEKEICKRIYENQDKEAKETLINSNLRLVVKIAHDFKNMGVSLSDLIGAGNIGLIKAVDNYKNDTNAKFSSYAALWIKAYMRKELSNLSRAVSFCENTLRSMKKVKSLADENYSVKEIAEEMKTSRKKHIYSLLNGYSEFSMNERINSEEARERGELLEDNNYNPFQFLENKDLIDFIIEKCKENFSERDRYIFFARYGLDNVDVKTQVELAEELQMTHQRIQQIESNIIKQIKKILTIRPLCLT